MITLRSIDERHRRIQAEATAFAVNYMPRPAQEALLNAALFSGAGCRKWWTEWLATADIDHLDEPSFRMLPQLYRNLRAEGIDHPLVGRLKGIHRRAWYNNQVLFADAVPILASLQEAGIPTMLLKGFPLSTLYYNDSGARPMKDIDILVPEDKAADAIELLATQQWIPQLQMPAVLNCWYKSARHAVGCRNPEHRELDLHWHVLRWWPRSAADREFWNHSVPLEFQGIHTRTLDATDLLVHVCTHAAEWQPVPAIRWVADAMMILRSAVIDWDRVLRYCREYQLSLFVTTSLLYLKNTMQASVPDGVMESLNHLRPSRSDLLQYAHSTGADLNLLQSLSAAYLDYLRCVPRRNLLQDVVGFPRFYQYRKDLDKVWRIPTYVIVNRVKRANLLFTLGRVEA